MKIHRKKAILFGICACLLAVLPCGRALADEGQPPCIASTNPGSGDLIEAQDTVTVIFSEPVYGEASISFSPVHGGERVNAQLSGDGQSLSMALSGLQEGESYGFTIRGLADAYGHPLDSGLFGFTVRQTADGGTDDDVTYVYETVVETAEPNVVYKGSRVTNGTQNAAGTNPGAGPGAAGQTEATPSPVPSPSPEASPSPSAAPESSNDEKDGNPQLLNPEEKPSDGVKAAGSQQNQLVWIILCAVGGAAVLAEIVYLIVHSIRKKKRQKEESL